MWQICVVCVLCECCIKACAIYDGIADAADFVPLQGDLDEYEADDTARLSNDFFFVILICTIALVIAIFVSAYCACVNRERHRTMAEYSQNMLDSAQYGEPPDVTMGGLTRKMAISMLQCRNHKRGRHGHHYRRGDMASETTVSRQSSYAYMNPHAMQSFGSFAPSGYAMESARMNYSRHNKHTAPRPPKHHDNRSPHNNDVTSRHSIPRLATTHTRGSGRVLNRPPFTRRGTTQKQAAASNIPMNDKRCVSGPRPPASVPGAIPRRTSHSRDDTAPMISRSSLPPAQPMRRDVSYGSGNYLLGLSYNSKQLTSVAETNRFKSTGKRSCDKTNDGVRTRGTYVQPAHENMNNNNNNMGACHFAVETMTCTYRNSTLEDTAEFMFVDCSLFSSATDQSCICHDVYKNLRP